MTTLGVMRLDVPNNTTLKFKSNKGKDVANAFGWFALFALSSILIIPALMIVGCLADWNLVVDGVYAITDVLLAAQKGNFSIESVGMSTIVAASNFCLVSLIASYIPTVIAMFVRRDVDGGYSKFEAKELYKWLTCFMVVNALAQFACEFVATIPAIAAQSNVLASVGCLSSAGNPLLALFATGIMAPIVEEITLRRGVQRSLCKINPAFGIITASLLFGLMHGNLIQGAFAAFMGVLLGYAYYKTNNLWVSTLMHIAVNSTSVLISLSGANLYVVFSLMPVVFGLLYFISCREK